MGLFDVSVRKEITSKKTRDEILDFLDKKLKNDSYKEMNRTATSIILDKYKAPSSYLKYNVNIDFEKQKDKTELNIYGELQDVWFFVIFIVLAILFTQGIAIIPLVGFVYYQKRVVSKYLEEILEHQIFNEKSS